MDADQPSSVLEKLDEIDREILRVLQDNSKLSLTEVGAEVKRRIEKRQEKTLKKEIPKSTIHAKIQRMKRLDVFKPRKAVLNEKTLGKNVTAFVFLTYQRIAGRERKRTAQLVVDHLKTLPGIQEIHILAGHTDILVKMKTENVGSLAKTVLSDIREIEGIAESSTAITLETHKETTEIDVPELHEQSWTYLKK